jgi:Flp pilus assembly protein TadD
MTRFTTSLIALLVCAPALAGCASDGGMFASGSHKKTEEASKDSAQSKETANLPTDVDSNVRQAQEDRLAGRYDDAIHLLSQLMLVASDDPRVVGEYGKTLAEKGRAQEAVQFLTRAVALQPAEWSFYSALGVAYDQVGDQASARNAYEQALRLHPGDAVILNNYALSRMLAKDPDMARQLMAKAQSAGGASDPKIARNIDLVNSLAPPALKTAADTAPDHGPIITPAPVSTQTLPAPSAANVPQHANTQVVMQPVPPDAKAGPAKSANRAPTPLNARAAKTPVPALKTDIKEAAADSAKATTAKSDAGKSDIAKSDAIKSNAAKTETKTAKAEPNASKLQTADVKAVKADAKDAKAADAKLETKTPAKPATKGGIPELRQTASVY